MIVNDHVPNLTAELREGVPRRDFYNAEILLPLCRLSIRDPPQLIMSRAYELYCELLPSNVQGWSRKTNELEERIATLGVLAEVVGEGVMSGHPPWFDPQVGEPLDDRRKVAAICNVLDSISLDDAGFASEIAADPAPLPFGTILRKPVLRSGGQYLFLHRDSLLTAADEDICANWTLARRISAASLESM